MKLVVKTFLFSSNKQITCGKRVAEIEMAGVKMNDVTILKAAQWWDVFKAMTSW